MKDLTEEDENTHIPRLTISLLILLIITLFMFGCSTLELNSNWREREITVDGGNTDWLGAMYYLEDENISVGLLNDDNYIYICMIAENNFIRTQVMGQGFKLWFDPDGNREKTFGIGFPLGRQNNQRKEMMMRFREEAADQEKIREYSEKSLTELEILGPGKDEKKRIQVKDIKGIEIVLDVSGGLLVYELKVPLHYSEQNPYAVGVKAGDLIGIGMETPKIDMNATKEKMKGRKPGSMGMPGGDRIGGGMGRMPGSKEMSGDRRSQMPKHLNIWAKVKLAKNSN